jgi:hypothetical protein
MAIFMLASFTIDALSTYDWDFAPMEKGSGEACLAGGGLLNMDNF